jgi:ADP-ribosyl-[dinitrogen reductase] hydrolase
MTDMQKAVTRADRIAGTIFGAAIGDALGAAYEMLPNDAIERHLASACVRDFEPALRGSLLFPRNAGLPTDDTAMALSVARALTRGEPLTADLFAHHFLQDVDRDDGDFGVMFWAGGPGGATTRALRRLHGGAPASANGHPDDGGNGAAMRVHPVGCLPDRDDVMRIAAMQARVTHGHPATVAAAQAIAVLVHEAIAGQSPSADVPLGIDNAIFERAWREAHRQLRHGGNRLPAHLRNVGMSGWETVAAAHAITLLFDEDAESAIGTAAASGGDTDTVAAIVGAIVGARYGRSALPARWLTGMNRGAIDICTTASNDLCMLPTKGKS